MMKKRITAALVAAITAASLMMTGCGGNKTETPAATEQAKVTPTFMYFVSNSDADFDAAQATIDELQEEYKDKVNFNVINIDENTEAASNFPVQGNTPMLIMLNTSNDISAMAPKCSDKDELKSYIDAALQ
ncbi:MAG: thioredoxin domain-containing protein [Hominilimicola sp.]